MVRLCYLWDDLRVTYESHSLLIKRRLWNSSSSDNISQGHQHCLLPTWPGLWILVMWLNIIIWSALVLFILMADGEISVRCHSLIIIHMKEEEKGSKEDKLQVVGDLATGWSNAFFLLLASTPCFKMLSRWQLVTFLVKHIVIDPPTHLFQLLG